MWIRTGSKKGRVEFGVVSLVGFVRQLRRHRMPLKLLLLMALLHLCLKPTLAVQLALQLNTQLIKKRTQHLMMGMAMLMMLDHAGLTYHSAPFSF